MRLPFALILAFGLLAGCAAMGGNLSAEQIAAASRDKSASAYCLTFTGAGGQVQTLYVNTDKSTISNGKSTLKCGNAEATFEESKPAAKP